MTLHLHNSAAVSALAPARMITWRSARLGVSSDFWIAGSFRCDESMCVMLLRVLAAAGLKVPELLMCFGAPKLLRYVKIRGIACNSLCYTKPKL